MPKTILRIEKLGFPWPTQNPFLFCVHHLDFYPRGNGNLGPDALLEGRNTGNDFVVKDGWRMYHGTKVPGFPAHPHRGFETVTFVLQGFVDHADSNGAAARYGEGDVQWMSAGSGLQHSEMFPLLNQNKENTLELFQIWLNLPAEKKQEKPAFKMMWRETIPSPVFYSNNKKQTRVDIVAGQIGDFRAPEPVPASWAFSNENEVAIWQISMEENALWEIPVAQQKINRSLYFFEGDSIQINKEKIAVNHFIELDSTQKIILHNENKPARLLLLQGKPIDEPVIQYGPFVMNSKMEIEQAFTDYKRTQFGGWPWPKQEQVHNKNLGRFVNTGDGREIIK
jgi:redox-sensitive bicupin YhaK (pirin superfamily)